ncbi:polysaccharide biosynthesis tyrosine autokinase [uncultured Porphyromonas sp.]|uniref:polysaccharide biosynthesis tyrosine autokinase n=1 Tax=uncultured Porphyromonas sp. TaxID=159274 RepID=UPI002605C9FD|nr:tyrosine-protein kinase [uncultured Porphyromonas sp.]
MEYPTASNQQEPIRSSEEVSTFSLRDILVILKANWLFILLSLLVCLILGFLYVKSSPHQYSRSASLLIKSETSINSAIERLAQFTGDKHSYSDDVSNQIIILGTERVVSETVRRLGLDVQYHYDAGLRERDLYKQSPVSIRFVNADPDEKISLRVKPDNDTNNQVLLYDIKSSLLGKVQEPIVAPLGDTIATPIGKVVVEATPYYSNFPSYEVLKVQKDNFNAVVRSYMKALQVSLQQKDASVIKLTIQSGNPLLAEDFLSTLILVYTELERSDKVKIAESTQRFVDERLAIISSELGQVDAEIEDFKQSQQIADIGAEAQEYIKGSSEVKARLVELNNGISVAQFVQGHLKDKSQMESLIPANVGIASPAIEAAIAKYNELLLKRNQLQTNSSSQNPLVQELNTQLAAQRLSIITSIENLISTLEVERQGILAEQSSYKGRITSVPMQERIVGSIYRQQKIKEELYLFLLNVREQNALSIEAAESNARLIQAPTGPAEPVSPRVPIIMLAALLLGLLIPAAVIYIRSVANNKVRGKADLETYTTIPLLGEVPHYKASRRYVKHVEEQIKEQLEGLDSKERSEVVDQASRMFIVGHHRRSVVSEAFTVIRSNISFLAPDRDESVKRILVTSAIPGSGKTFTSSNLALSLAQSGKRVLLVNCDIRKNTLSKAIGRHQTGQQGLSTYLSDSRINPEMVICATTQSEMLSVVPSGPVPPNPTELFMSPRFEELLRYADEHFDYIVLDTIPVLNLADTRVISHLADITVMVVRENHLPRRLLPELESLYREKRLKGLCLVLNDAGVGASSYGYGYGSYGYGSYGSYGSDEEHK